MKIGACCCQDKALSAIENGAEYIEEFLANLANMSEADFSRTLRFYKENGVTVYATNGFLMGGFCMYEADFFDKFKPYVTLALKRASLLGVRVCVFGSGGARNIPEGVSKAQAFDILTEALTYAGEQANKYGIKIAIEPLSRKETNFINTVAEAIEVAAATGLDNVGALVDFFHFYMNGEGEDGLLCAKGRLFHAHIARPNADRKMPTMQDLPTLKKWADMLKAIDYKGNISLEGSFPCFSEDVCSAVKAITSIRSN